MYDAFISYSRRDSWWVSTLANALRRRRHPDSSSRLRVFLDTDSIGVGKNWIQTIETALIESRHIIPIYSSSYFESDGAGWELLQKLLPDLTAAHRSILPCLIESCEIPPRVRHIQYLDFRGLENTTSLSFLNKLDELVEVIKGTHPKRPRPAVKSSDKPLPQFPYYVYISDSKLQMLGRRSFQNRDIEQVAASQDRFSTVSAIVNDLAANDQIGSLQSEKPFISGEFSMKWGVVDWGVCDQDVRIVFFFTDSTDPMILLAGSVHHVIGALPGGFEFPGGAFGHSGSNLPGIVWALWGLSHRSRPRNSAIDDYLLASSLCHGELSTVWGEEMLAPNFAEQPLNFVARVLTHLPAPTASELRKWNRNQRNLFGDGTETRLFPRRRRKDVVIASPLYVALAERSPAAVISIKSEQLER